MGTIYPDSATFPRISSKISWSKKVYAMASLFRRRGHVQWPGPFLGAVDRVSVGDQAGRDQRRAGGLGNDLHARAEAKLLHRPNPAGGGGKTGKPVSGHR